eukprot:COSAG02_NODE_10581_length_1908_cov_1.971808_2_plen_122_part_00
MDASCVDLIYGIGISGSVNLRPGAVADGQRRKLRSIDLFLRTLQTGGDLAAQLRATLNQQGDRLASDASVRSTCETKTCDACAKRAEELHVERQNRLALEEECAAQKRRIAELEKLLAVAK